MARFVRGEERVEFCGRFCLGVSGGVALSSIQYLARKASS